MAEALDFVGDFLIQETTGSVQDIILLKGRALPFRPLSVEGVQREDTTWYQGSPVGSQQVHGAQEMPTTINGKWCDRYIGETDLEFAAVNGVTIDNVRDLTAAVDGIRRRGTEVLVQWMHISRRGVLKRFKQTWQNFHDVEWEIEFSWNSIDDADISNLGTREFDLSDLSGAFAADVIELSAASTPFIERLHSWTESMTSSVAKMTSAIADLESTISSYLDGAYGAIDAARRALSVVDIVIATTDDLITQLYAVTDAAASGLTLIGGFIDFSAFASVRFGDTLRSARATRDAVSIARRMRRNAAQARADIIRSQSPDLRAAFVAKVRTDLREVSVKYFGTPNHWHALQRFNNLSASYIDGGQVLLIPRDPGSVGAC